VLEQQSIDVAGDVSDSRELLAWFKTNQADLLPFDWELPGQSGKKIIPILRARHPVLAVIVLDSRPQTWTSIKTAYTLKAEFQFKSSAYCHPISSRGDSNRS